LRSKVGVVGPHWHKKKTVHWESVVVRTWTFADECGNSSSVSQTININDPEAPVTPTIPNELFFSCANEVPPPLPLTATDNCEGPITALPEIEVIPQNCPNKYTEIRTWNFVDACGNASSLSQTIVVNDLIPPSAMNIPADTIINCADPLEFGPGPNWIDNCGGMIGLMSFEDDTIAGTCPNEWMVTRTWSVVDDCGILGTASQTITIVDPNPPVFSFVPDTIVADCGQMPEFESPIADDACGAVTLTFEESSSQGAVCQGGGYQKRLWTATDECGNTAQVETVLIFLPDTIAPSFVFVPSTPDVDCDEIPEFETPIATDNCGEVELTFEEYQSPGTICDTGFSKKRLWTATDECGNTAQVETAIWVNPDIEAPQFIYIPPTPDVDCDEVPDFEIPEVIDNCGEVELTFEEYQSPGTLCDDGYALKRLWTATDECGNTAQVETAIWVYPDVAAPVFHFIPADSVIACDAFPPVFGEPLVSDACGSFELTFTTQFISGDSSSCANGQMAQYQRIWTAKDNCGQSSTAQQTFTLTAQGNIMGILSGTLRNEQAETIEGAEVRVEGTAGMPLLAQTTSEGSYAFDLPLQHNYQVLPQYDAHPLNGVSTLDLILISKHLLGIEWLDSPYKMIAADVNRSGSLTAYDLVELRKAILYITDGFANNTSWRFIEESFVFVNPMNPFSTTFPEAAAINGLTESEVVNFVGVKIGDVDNSATANSLLGGQTRSEENPFYFAVNDQYLETGKTYEITLAAHAFAQLLGYQFTLEYDREKIRLFDIQTADSPDRGTVHFGLNQLEKGQLTGTWYTTSAKELTKGNQLFTLQFTALQNGQLSEALQLNSKATTAEVYRENGQTSPLNLYFNPSKSAENPLHFALLQNYPNPFKESTQIRFTLPQASTATLQIYDLSGQLLWEKTDEFAQGHNEVPVDQSDLIGNGVFYYRLETPTRNAMKRMIVLYD
ncbi:MAG: T9SS type A sorting domain-containing protein, partial [Bacteroidota bacterium]